jgi:hypothetical protein
MGRRVQDDQDRFNIVVTPDREPALLVIDDNRDVAERPALVGHLTGSHM